MVKLYTPIADQSENAKQVEIGTAGGTIAKAVLFSVYVPNLDAKSVVFLKTQFECTGPFVHYCGVGRYIIRTDSPTSTSGTKVTNKVMDNLIENSFSKVVVFTGTDWNIPEGDYYYNLIVYAMSGGSVVGESLQFPENYGDLTAIVMERGDTCRHICASPS